MPVKVVVNDRINRLMEYLVPQESYVTTKELTNNLSVTSRSVRYDLSKINDLMENDCVKPIKIVRGRGILIDEDHRRWWMQFSSKNNLEYVYEQDIRISIIISEIILRKNVHINYLVEKLNVSKNTIFLDLKAVKEIVSNSKAELKYNNSRGYYIESELLVRRQLYMINIVKIFRIVKEGVLDYLSNERVTDVQNKLREFRYELDVRYVLSMCNIISIYMGMIDDYHLFVESIDKEKYDFILSSAKFNIVDRIFVGYTTEFKLYLTAQLMCLDFKPSMDHYDVTNISPHIRDGVAKFVTSFEKFTSITFVNKSRLFDIVMVFMQKVEYRRMFNIDYDYNIAEYVKSNYHSLYNIVQIVLKEYFNKSFTIIKENDICILTQMIGIHLRRFVTASKKINVVFVSATNLKKTKILVDKINAYFNMIHISRIVEPKEIYYLEDDYDFIITDLVELNASIPVVCINMVLDDKTKEDILSQIIVVKTNSSRGQSNEIFQIVKNYIPKENQYEAKEAIDRYFRNTSPKMAQILKKEFVQIIDSVKDWKRGVELSALPLLQKGYITSEYIEALTINIEIYPSYAYIAKGVVLAHARPEFGCNKLGVSILKVNHPIEFLDDNINYIITLAPVDSTSHFKIIQEIIVICHAVEFLQEMRSVTSTSVLHDKILTFLFNKKI
ncbi:PTS sugar transporter subunit IIA [Wukongibacter baidiensis]|uniref:BglG family transcription antiterminator n=1 Tax=Wukongibacter baidiensis TaxID=1723361 RepID=UPI003D7FD792